MSDRLADIAVALSGSPELAVLAKATLVLLAVLAGVRLARGARASLRHLLVAAGFVTLLLLPVAAIVMTPVVVEVSGVSPAVREPAAAASDGEEVGPAARSVSKSVPPSVPVLGRIPPSASAPFSPAGLLRGVWALGVALFLTPIAAALWRVGRVRRRAERWSEGEAFVHQLDADARLARRVVVLRHEGVEAPMTCGIVRPAIVLPWDADAWSASDMRHALIHELEHVAEATGQCTLSLEWFVPPIGPLCGPERGFRTRCATA